MRETCKEGQVGEERLILALFAILKENDFENNEVVGVKLHIYYDITCFEDQRS